MAAERPDIDPLANWANRFLTPLVILSSQGPATQAGPWDENSESLLPISLLLASNHWPVVRLGLHTSSLSAWRPRGAGGSDPTCDRGASGVPQQKAHASPEACARALSQSWLVSLWGVDSLSFDQERPLLFALL